MLWKDQVFTVIVNKPFSVQKCLEIYWVLLLLLIKDISVTSKFLFYDFELYVDELYNNIILYFQFFPTQIHEIITSCLFYEKDLTKNDKKNRTRISLSSKFLFYDFKLYIDELYDTIVLHFQPCLIRIHEIITSQFFYEKYLTENDEKIEDSIEFSQ